uniref:F-box domain-containing protein n=1 Tax=Anopheles farauti TaxID=69004 RepID=A0A182R0M8_9DIPT
MASINQMPTEILEMIFNQLDFKSRLNATLVCQRWNAVAMSERFTKRKVFFKIDSNSVLTLHKHTFHRSYQNLLLKLDDSPEGKDTTKGLRLLTTIFPTIASIKLEMAVWSDQWWYSLMKNHNACFLTVDTLHLTANYNLPRTEHLKENNRHYRMSSLRTSVLAPELRKLYLAVNTMGKMHMLQDVLYQLHTLEIVLTSYVYLHFYNFKPINLRALSIDRRHKGMVQHEREPSVIFFGQLVNLRRLELKVKFFDSYVLNKIAEMLPQLVELSLEACEGMIDLSLIGNLSRLERLRVIAGSIDLTNLYLPLLRTLCLGTAPENYVTPKLEGIETLMRFPSLQSLTLVNIRFNSDIQKLTPSYSLQNMILLNYRQLKDVHVLKLVKRFPVVRWLRISHCYGIYRPEIEKLKRLLPKVAIAFDEVKVI